MLTFVVVSVSLYISVGWCDNIDDGDNLQLERSCKALPWRIHIYEEGDDDEWPFVQWPFVRVALCPVAFCPSGLLSGSQFPHG